MKARTMLFTVALFLIAATFAYAGNLNMGTWKLNEAKSKIPAGAVKNTLVKYEAVGDNIKVTVDGVDGMGKPIHNEWTGKLDGKDYPLMGDPTADTRCYKIVNDHTTKLVNKKDGKAAQSGEIVISADGKSRTLTVSGTDAAGKKMTYMAVYDKE
jgi:hypothetical protein